jgi:hypothetical protein
LMWVKLYQKHYQRVSLLRQGFVQNHQEEMWLFYKLGPQLVGSSLYQKKNLPFVRMT